MSKKEHQSSDAPLTDFEVKDIISEFQKKYQMPKYQVPIHYSFRAQIRFKKTKADKEGIVVLTPHYVGLFIPKENKEKGCQLLVTNEGEGIIHILDIYQVYYRVNVFACLMLDDKCYYKVILRSPRSTRFAQLLYRNYRFTFAGKKSDKNIDDFFKSDLKDSLPPIKFESDDPNFNKKTKGDHTNIVISPSQKFQFSYFANCTHCDPGSFNQEVVRFVHNLILSDNTIINISQLPLELASSMTSKRKSSRKSGNNKPESDNSDSGNDDDKNNADDNQNENDDANAGQDENENDNQVNQGDDKNGDENDDQKGNENNDNQPTGNDNKKKKSKKHRKHKSKAENEESGSSGGVSLRSIFLSLNKTNLIAGVTAVKIHKPKILHSLAELISLDQKLRIIHFENCDIKDSLHKLSKEISKTKEFKVAYWNLSNNRNLNFKYFPDIISRSTYPINYINLSKCNIKADLSTEIFKKLSENEHLNELQFLMYSQNHLDHPDCISSLRTLMDRISKNDSKLKYIDFSSLETSAEFAGVLDILKDHSSLPIETLILKGFDAGEERTSLENLKSIIQKSKSLKKLDISKMAIKNDNYEQLFEIINSIVENSDLSNFDLRLNHLKLNDEKIVILFRSFLTNAKSKSNRGDLTRSQMLKSSRRSKIEEDATEHLGLSKWKSLSFNNNGMNSNDLFNLISLFQRMTNLEELSFNDNFNDSMSDIVSNLESLLNMSQSKRSSVKSFPKIKKLSIAGTPKGKSHKNFLRKYLYDFLTIVSEKYSHQIVYLDVSNNQAGDRLVEPLKNLLHSPNTVIETLIFDGNGISDIGKLKELAEKAKGCKTLITFPFPKNDAEDIIEKSTDKPSAIEQLAEVQISFIQATNAHRRKLKLPEDLPFTHDESVKKLIQKIIKEAKKDESNGPKDYLRHHTKFCQSLGLPFPHEKMGKLVLDDEAYEDTAIGGMRRYEPKDDDAPEFTKNKKDESDNVQLAKWYCEREGEEEEEEEEDDKEEEENKEEEKKKEEENEEEEEKERSVPPPRPRGRKPDDEEDPKGRNSSIKKPSSDKDSIKNRNGKRSDDSDGSDEEDPKGRNSSIKKPSSDRNSIKNRNGKRPGDSDGSDEEEPKGRNSSIKKPSSDRNSIKNRNGKRSDDSEGSDEEEPKGRNSSRKKPSSGKNSNRNRNGKRSDDSEGSDEEDPKGRSSSKRKPSNGRGSSRNRNGRRPDDSEGSDEEDRRKPSNSRRPSSSKRSKKNDSDYSFTPESETDSEEDDKAQRKRSAARNSRKSSSIKGRDIKRRGSDSEDDSEYDSNPRNRKKPSSPSRGKPAGTKERSGRRGGNRSEGSDYDDVDIDYSSDKGRRPSRKQQNGRKSSRRVQESSDDSIELEKLHTRFNEPSDESSSSSVRQPRNSRPANRRTGRK